jgi:hypothetical protein
MLHGLQVSGQGNFGSLDDDPPAAMRYTECRLSSAAEELLLADLEADTVDFATTFDASQVTIHARPWTCVPVWIAAIAVAPGAHVNWLLGDRHAAGRLGGRRCRLCNNVWRLTGELHVLVLCG